MENKLNRYKVRYYKAKKEEITDWTFFLVMLVLLNAMLFIK